MEEQEKEEEKTAMTVKVVGPLQKKQTKRI